MATPLTIGQPPEIEYPDCDGEPLSDNTLQLEWIFLLKGNLDALFKDAPNVFVAGNLLWYPVQGHPEIRVAPDALVAFGRPKGYRGSYRQWEEGGIAPQVVFEVLSPGNRPDEMADKLRFYDTYGVEEYYLYDPNNVQLSGWRRVGAALQAIPVMHNWVSPRLKIHFDLSEPELVLRDPKGQRFLTYLERQKQQEAAEQLAEQERLQREKAEQQAKDEQLQRQQAEKQAKGEQLQREKAELQAKAAQESAEQERLQREKAEQQAKDDRLQREKAEQQAKAARDLAEQDRLQREKAEQLTEQERSKREQLEERARQLADRLRELGIDPDSLSG